MRGKEDFQQGAVADQVRVIFHADGFHMTGVLLAHLLVRWVLDLAPTVPRDDIKHPLQGSEDRLGAPETTATEYRLLCHAEAPVMYDCRARARLPRSEEHTSELQSLMRISYAVFCLKKKKQQEQTSQQISTIKIETRTTTQTKIRISII